MDFVMNFVRDWWQKPLLRRILLYQLLVLLLSAYFVLSRPVAWPLALTVLLLALPLGGLFGLAQAIFDRLLQAVAAGVQRRWPEVSAGFLLFFGYLIGYILLFAGMVAYPLGLLVERGGAVGATGQDFKLYSMNFVLLLALWSWLDFRRQWGEALLGWLHFWLIRIRRQETP
ncbi:hypothetical protein [Desulfurivibrio alkaliphilus]|uniref:Uncharacterized protein n=1 Tax=Desulfurivibrio alkaliphilus (strain DSM 19089 / UNIQEM U267 / AHT2) TaxID=589865 RepID=D6Z364_DESAT|nr:hypothetical protein [Desulfurivibrio alkaliphilus]ADH85989.1 hypothetical protein DaAHT2_1294 [Desulfurivibrio alkaliphilus AHT 2]